MAYLDSKEIAYFSTGRLPITAAGTDPSLPTLGTGEYDWQGFLSLEQHPHEAGPASDVFLNWNNKPAPEFGAASDNYSYGSVAGIDNPPSSGGSSFDGGWYGYVEKDLRSLLGQPVIQPFNHHFCGNGSLEACRASLWAVVQKAAEGLVATQGPDMTKWKAAKVRITFPPGLLPSYTMRWTNRSTFQQVIEFTGHE
jgi:hypothetical protein